MTNQNEDRLLTIQELSTLTGLTVGTLYHFVSQGRVPVVRISSRCIRFRKSDLNNWIAEKVCPIAKEINGRRA
jgi:excisionase family DNA binding protein